MGVLAPDCLWSLGEGPPSVWVGVLPRLLGPAPHSLNSASALQGPPSPPGPQTGEQGVGSIRGKQVPLPPASIPRLVRCPWPHKDS